MLGKSTFGVFFILSQFFQNAVSESISVDDFCQMIQDKPVPYPTLAPINLNTKRAISINGTTPLIVKNGLLGPLLIKNTGYAIEIYGHPAVFTTSGSYGGVLCNRFYKFHKARFYVNQNPKGGSYGEVNGIAPPVTVSLLYYNSKYPSFKKALNHRDGVANEIFHYTLGILPNPLFAPVGPLISLLREPGTFSYVNEALAYAFFVRTPLITKYYAYLGSYEDLETGKQYECTMNIVANGIYTVFNKFQLKTSFGLLKNINGSKLQTVSRTYPVGQRKIYEAPGLQARFVPI